MFGVAGLVYLFVMGGAPVNFLGSIPTKLKKIVDDDDDPAPGHRAGRKNNTTGEKKQLSTDDLVTVKSMWDQVKAQSSTGNVELSNVVHTMQKLGCSVADVLVELRGALEANPELLSCVSTLATSLLRDDAVELLDGTVKLLEAHRQPVDAAMYAGLMGAQLRRRNYAAVSATAKSIPSEDINCKMRLMLTTAAVHLGHLDEALSHIRQVTTPADGSSAGLAPGAAIHLLSLAAKEQRVQAAAAELQRIRARVETKQLEELIRAEAKRSGAAAAGTCRDLIDAGVSLNVPKGAVAFQALAQAHAAAGEAEEVRALVEELETMGGGPLGLSVTEPLALSLVAAAKVIHDADVALRVLELHRF